MSHALIIGEALIDIVQTKTESGIATSEIPGGSPANVALGLGRLGRKTKLACWIGEDERGSTLAEHLHQSGVELTEGSTLADHTSTALAQIGKDGSASYIFDLQWAPVPVNDKGALVVHTGSIAATLEPGNKVVAAAISAARPTATITYDPNARPTLMGAPTKALNQVLSLVKLSDVVKVSDEDITWLTGGKSVDETAAQWAKLGPALVIVTRGPDGASAWFGSERLDWPGPNVNVVDTVGAGDSFMGGIIDALWTLNLLGSDKRKALHRIETDAVREVLRRASSISTITVSRAGADLPWAKELD